jgi:hypothetical protein
MSEDGTTYVTNLRITVDPRRDNLVAVVLHELLHAYMYLFLEIDAKLSEELEEKAILAWEEALTTYLRLPKNEKLLESWSQAVERKLS